MHNVPEQTACAVPVALTPRFGSVMRDELAPSVCFSEDWERYPVCQGVRTGALVRICTFDFGWQCVDIPKERPGEYTGVQDH